MADLDYRVSVDVSDAERNLTNLQRSITGINSAFSGLKTLLAGISLGAIIAQAITLADSITDISDSTGIATANILGFTRALIDNGGSADGAQKAILKLVGAIGEAADGGAETQKAFAAVGVTLKDLATLSEQDILGKTIQGLANIGDAAQRSVLSAKLLGKEFRGVGIAGVAGSYAQATAESAKYTAAIKSAADAQGNIDRTLTDFKIAVLDAIRPITELVTSLNVGVDGFRKFIQAVLAVGVALAAVFVGGRIIVGIRLFYAALLAVANGAKNLFELFKNVYTGFGSLIRATEGAGGAFNRMWLVIKQVLLVMAELAGPAFAALKTIAVPVLATLAGWWGYVQESTTDAIEELKKYLNYLPFVNIDVGTGRGRGDPKEIANREAAAKAEKENADRIREVVDALAKRRAEIQKSSRAFKDQNNEILTSIEFEKLLIGKTEDVIEVERARDAMAKRADDQIATLREAKKALTKDEQALSAVYDQQIAKIEATYRIDVERVASGIEGLQSLRMLEAARLQDIENTTKAIESQIERQSQLGGLLQSINDKRVDFGFEKSLKGLTPLQQEIAKIQESARKASLEAGRSFSAAFDSEDGLTPERASELANGLNQIAQGYRDIAQSQIDAVVNVSPLMDAWELYKQNALDTGSQIKSSFDNFTGGMEDAIVKFVQTGKLSFKDLAQSVIADLARIAAKRAIVAVGTSLFGFANGGDVMSKTPIIVGERGPELFIPQSAGSIVSNATLKGSGQSADYGGGQTIVNYNIQAVDASSFRSLVARDPSFIYAVTEQGRRSQPTRRAF